MCGLRIGAGFALFLVLLFSSDMVRASKEVDHSILGDLLSRHAQGGLVDYQGFKTDERKLDEYLQLLERVSSDELPRKEQLAFYINAYNAWTVKLILGNYPGIKSIKDLGSAFSSPWKKKICRIDGKTLSLDDIEHGILRPRFHDPRIHFAVNCASKSCPPLAPEPYSGATLDRQLDEAVRLFVNDPSHYRFNGDDLHVSMIFRWYASDFKDGVLSFIVRYAEGGLKQILVSKRDKIRLKYLDYDWSLNTK